MVGGSGLYVDAVVKGLDEFPEVDPEYQGASKEGAGGKGIRNRFRKNLKLKDPEYYSEVDLQNPHRVIRALEICRGTGKPYSAFRKESCQKSLF